MLHRPFAGADDDFRMSDVDFRCVTSDFLVTDGHFRPVDGDFSSSDRASGLPMTMSIVAVSPAARKIMISVTDTAVTSAATSNSRFEGTNQSVTDRLVPFSRVSACIMLNH